MDRTFVADGWRWIIDYKTARPDASEQQSEFTARQVERYRGQLLRYERVARAAFGHPCRLGLYFTALPLLVMIDESS